ncbi:MAG: hypothetical protein M3Y66_08480, partial [Actinomycetota bacterium]|nr:hypothetical protein [Actinomycetota bacterium]
MYGIDARPVTQSDGEKQNMDTTRRHRRLLVAPAVAFATATMLVMGAGAATASDPNPVGPILHQVHKTVHKITQPAAKAASRASASSPNAPNAAPGDSPGHVTTRPAAPDHGSSYVGHVVVGGHNLADVANGNSTVKDNNGSSADSTLLAIAGTEIIGSHASSDGNNTSHGVFPTIPVCTSTNGALCADLLFSDSYATNNGSTSAANTRNGVATACVGGTDPSGTTCSGYLGASAGTSRSSSQRDLQTGHTTAASDSSVSQACVRQTVAGTCAVSAGVLSSDGNADSNGTASRHSQVLGLNIAGNPAGLPTSPFGISVPPNCTTPSLLCVFGNQGETYLAPGLAGTSQSALDVYGLNRTLQVGLAHSETLAHNAGDSG